MNKRKMTYKPKVKNVVKLEKYLKRNGEKTNISINTKRI